MVTIRALRLALRMPSEPQNWALPQVHIVPVQSKNEELIYKAIGPLHEHRPVYTAWVVWLSTDRCRHLRPT